MPDGEAAWLDVTQVIEEAMVRWPGQPRTQRERIGSIGEGKNSNVSVLTMSLHTGTHMDAPLHFFKDGADITAAPFEAMFGPVRVARVEGEMVTRAGIEAYEGRSGRLEPGERIIFRTRNSERDWSTEPFDEHYAAVDADAATYLASRRLVVVGVDYLSVAPFANTVETHLTLLGAGVWIIEGLDLRAVDEGRYEMVALPLKIKGSDASPLRVLLRRT